jgi:hypothetical protein
MVFRKRRQTINAKMLFDVSFQNLISFFKVTFEMRISKKLDDL